MAYKGTSVTATGMDVLAALQKRLTTNGYNLNDAQLTTLMVDVMNVINTDSSNATAHAATEIAANKVRPFVPGA